MSILVEEGQVLRRLGEFAHERDACVTIARSPSAFSGEEWCVEILPGRAARTQARAGYGIHVSLPEAISQALLEAKA